ncbi:MAG TPA: cupin domain-containing protein [Terriglobales bacterium]|jgi:uncharacterized cupin superfamily protein|nr:cupin domain-containing protein [Terriglobales bacterium]
MTSPAILASEVPGRTTSAYPEPFASRTKGRVKHALGDFFGLKNFGVNLTRLPPGKISSVRHTHVKQDELVFVLEGNPTLVTDEGRTPLSPGMCAGFRAGNGNAHHLVNETDKDAVYLEIGDRTPGETATYPDDDLALQVIDGKFRYFHKDGTPY